MILKIITTQQMFKVLNSNFNQRGYQYKLGLNKLDKPFEKTGSCVAGGLYYTNLEYIHLFFEEYGNIVCQVTIPEDAEYVQDACKNVIKFRANELILSNPLSIPDFIMKYDIDAMDYASRHGHLQVVEYLHSINKDCSIWAMNYASSNGSQSSLRSSIELTQS